MHQFKINGKMAFDGDVWQWHQDFGTWQNDDDMPEPRAMNVAIFLDEVNEFNGPLMFIPGSHKLGVLDAEHDTCDDQLSAVDDQPRHDRDAGRARRHRRAQGAGGLDDPVPLVPGARVDLEPLAVEPRQRVPEPVRGVEPHPPLQAARNTSRTATSRRSSACPTIACCADYAGRAAVEGRHAARGAALQLAAWRRLRRKLHEPLRQAAAARRAEAIRCASG